MAAIGLLEISYLPDWRCHEGRFRPSPALVRRETRCFCASQPLWVPFTGRQRTLSKLALPCSSVGHAAARVICGLPRLRPAGGSGTLLVWQVGVFIFLEKAGAVDPSELFGR